MANEPARNQDVRDVWQNQRGEEVQMSVDAIRLKAGKYRSKIAWRNVREYIGVLFVVGFFGLQSTHTTDLLMRVGSGLIIAGSIYIAWHLYAKGSGRRLPGTLGLSSSIEFHREELVRQRDLVRSVPRWYLGPMIPGLVVLMVAVGRANPGHVKHFGWIFGSYCVFMALVFAGVWWMNTRAARKIQKRIDELDRLRGEAE
jgi:hypothetical protein